MDVVGSVDSVPGEFVLILEGMAATSADGDGDPFAVQLTPDMVASGVPLTVYMISVTDDLDPMTILTYSDGETFYDDDNNPIYCDDAGDNSRCWGESTNLSQSFVTRENGRQLGGFGRDAMLSIPLDGFTLDSDPSQNYVNYLMTSYEQSTFGDYILAFHAGIGEGSSSGTKGNAGPGKGEQSDDNPTPVPPDTSDVPMGISVTCDNGASFDNGVEIRVDLMRSGFTYTATAIGSDGFDPVLAVLNEDGFGTCSDNANSASDYTFDLPTTGRGTPSNLSAQLDFTQNSGQGMADVSLVVGSLGNTSGEFVLVLEGMAATAADGPGDAFSVRMTPGMVASGVPLSVYMISLTNDLDPLMAYVDENLEVLYDTDNVPIICDDAGDTSRCWGESFSLNDSYVMLADGRRLGGFGRDAMLSLPLGNFTLSEDTNFNYLNFLMTTYEQSSFGEYILAFHVGLEHSGGGNADV
jgi:hypothetical protein